MARRICPRCSNRKLLSIVYGYPAGDLMEAAQRGEVALGGCMVTGDDPDRRCPDCRVDLYRDGTYRHTDGFGMGPDLLAVVLSHADDGVVEASIEMEGGLAIYRYVLSAGAPASIPEVMVEVLGDDGPTASLMLMIQRFGADVDIPGWLTSRHIPFEGGASGLLERVAVDADGVRFYQTGGDTWVPPGEPAARVLLGTLVDLIADGTFSGVDDLAGWLAEHGVEVAGTAV